MASNHFSPRNESYAMGTDNAKFAMCFSKLLQSDVLNKN